MHHGEREEMVISMKGLSKCLLFSRVDEDYENWRVLVDDWIDMYGEERKYHGLEMRRAIQGELVG